MNKLLILKDESVDWELFYSTHMKKNKIDVEKIYNNKWKISDFICHIFMHFDLPGCSFFWGKWKKKIDNYNTVIIFDRLYSQNIIKYIKKNNSDIRVIFWYWNLIESKFKEPKYRKLAEYWTFDMGDEKRYELKKNHQFYFNNIHSQIEMEKSDVFFVGTDKGRYNNLKSLQDILNHAGLKTSFFIIRDRYSDKNGKYSEFMNYDTIIKYINSTKCIVDYYQEKQKGLTLRTLEAIFFNKKVITNNLEIKKYSFYRPDRFLVIPDEMNRLDEFMQSDISVYTENERFQYSYESWLENFNIDWRNLE